MKVIKEPCTNCWELTLKWILIKNNSLCNNCLTKPKPKPLEIKQPVISTQLPQYTASYLNNKLWINYNSIKKETKCIKVWDKYILHEDIIAYYKGSLQLL